LSRHDPDRSIAARQDGPQPPRRRVDGPTAFAGRQLALEPRDFIRPNKPVENAYAESFNGRFRDECLNENWFTSLLDARDDDRALETRLQREAAAQLFGRRNADGVSKPLPRTEHIAGRKRGQVS